MNDYGFSIEIEVVDDIDEIKEAIINYPDGSQAFLSDAISSKDVSFDRKLGDFLDEIRNAFTQGVEAGRNSSDDSSTR